MKERIVEFIRNRGGGVSFVELGRIDGFAGDAELTYRQNTILWHEISTEAAAAILELIEAGTVVMHPSSVLVYACDGVMLSLPTARQNRTYKRPRWLPVVFWLPEQMDWKRSKGGAR